MLKINKTFVLVSLTLFVFGVFGAVTPLVHAQPAPGNYIPLAPLPNTTTASGETNFNTYVVGMFALLIGVATVLAVIMIVIGGIEYISSAAVGGKSDGKEKITQALYGLLLAASCWLILYTVNPDLLKFDVLNSIPTSYNQGTYYGATPPGTPGWYVRYEFMCVTATSVWSTAYLGPMESEEVCRDPGIAHFHRGICPDGHEQELQNLSCIEVLP